MTAIQPTDHRTTKEFGMCNFETWQDLAKRVAYIAAFLILPLGSYFLLGPIASAIVLSLESVGLGLYLGYKASIDCWALLLGNHWKTTQRSSA